MQLIQLHQRFGVDGADVVQLGVHQLPEGVQPDPVDHDLDAGHHAVLAKHVRVVEDRPDSEGDAQVVLLRDELVEGLRQPGHDGGSAAHEHLESPFDRAVFVPHLGHVGEVLDCGRYVVVGVAPGESRLELAREVLGYGMPDAETHVGGQVGRWIEHFVGGYTGGGRPDDVTHRVATCLPRGKSHFSQQVQHFGAVVQRYVVHLDVFPGGDMPLPEGRVPFGYVAERPQGLGRQYPAGQFHANHLNVGLALTIDALAKPVGSELGVVQLSTLELA